MRLLFSYNTEDNTLVCMDDQGNILDNVTNVSICQSLDPEKSGKFDLYMNSTEVEDGMNVNEMTSCCASKENKTKKAIKEIFKND